MLKNNVFELTDGNNKYRFRIKQMSASKRYDLCFKILLLFSEGGFKLDPENDDIADLANLFFKNGLSMLKGIQYEKARPILNEIFNCCWRVIKEGDEQQMDLDTCDGILTNPKSIMRLQMESFKLQFDFLIEGEKEESRSDSPAPVNIGRPQHQKG